MKYLVRLKPLKPYFFGSENSFSDDDIRKESRYFAKSLLFPQQTTIIGMLRREILRKNNIMTIHKKGEWADVGKKDKEDTPTYKEAVRLAGKGDVFSGNLGIINSISEIFLLNKDEFIFKSEKDRYIKDISKTDIEVSLNGEIRKFINFNIDSKKGIKENFVSTLKSYEFDDIFKNSISVGIKIDTKENGFYQKESFILKDDFEFGFILDLDENIDLSGIVEIGGDNSLFHLKLEEYKEIEYPFTKKEIDRFIILSDTLLDKTIMKYVDFILGDSYLIRTIKRGKNKTKRQKVLKAGSVIYPNDIKKVEELLNDFNLQKIGMNKFKKEIKNV